MDIKVIEVLGENIGIEDAILLREIIRTHINVGVTVDFEGFEDVSAVFLNKLLSDLIYKFGREYIFEQVSVKNLSNYSNFSRVVLGTTFE